MPTYTVQDLRTEIEAFAAAQSSRNVGMGSVSGVFDQVLDIVDARIYRANHIIVSSVDDLPIPSGGIHQLLDNTYYQFNGTVTSADALQRGTNTMVGGWAPLRPGWFRLHGHRGG